MNPRSSAHRTGISGPGSPGALHELASHSHEHECPSTHAAETSVGRFVFTFDAFELTDERRRTVRMGFPNEPSTALTVLTKC